MYSVFIISHDLRCGSLGPHILTVAIFEVCLWTPYQFCITLYSCDGRVALYSAFTPSRIMSVYPVFCSVGAASHGKLHLVQLDL